MKVFHVFLLSTVFLLVAGNPALGQAVLETNEGYYGFDEDLQLVSPLSGRQKACEAKLDICFKGVQFDFVALGFTGCIDACADVMEKPSCSLGDCESRCPGLFGLGPKCDDNLVYPLSEDPEADVFLVETPAVFFGVAGNHLLSPPPGRVLWRRASVCPTS